MFNRILNKIFSRSFSKYEAKNRLKIVLTQDRTGLSSNDMETFRRDLLKVISTYFVIESNRLDIEWDKKGDATTLVINTPVSIRTITGGKGRGGVNKKAVGAK